MLPCGLNVDILLMPSKHQQVFAMLTDCPGTIREHDLHTTCVDVSLCQSGIAVSWNELGGYIGFKVFGYGIQKI